MNITRFKFILVLLCLFLAAQQIDAQCNIALSAVVTNVSCFGGSNGALDLTPAGGTPPYTFTWSNGVTDMEDIADLPAGQYIVTVTDALGCNANLARTINQPALLAVGISGEDIDCTHFQFTGQPIYYTDLTANANGGTTPYFYVWSNNGNGNIQSVTEAGIYTVTVIDGNSCLATAEKVVLADTISPIADAGPDLNFDCQTAQLKLGGNGSSAGQGISYNWTGPGITNGANGNSTDQFPVVKTPGVYTLEVIDVANFCAGQDVVVVGGTPPPIANAGPDMGIPCGGGQVTLDGSGSSSGVQYVYLWTTVDGNIAAGGTTIHPIVNLAGTYTLTVINVLTGCSKTDMVKVFPGPAIPQSDFFLLDVSCTGQLGVASVTMSQGTGPYLYLWSNGSTQSGIVNIVQGIYTVTVTDVTGCNYYAEVEIKETSKMTLSAQTTAPSCNLGNNGVIDLTATSLFGPFNYVWNTGGTTQDLSNLAAGTYTVTVTYAGGTCTQTLSVPLGAPAMTLSTVVTDASSCAGTNGHIDLTVTGGTAPYLYIWSDGETAQNASPIVIGTFTVTVTDASGCTKTASATVGQSPALTLSAAVIASNSCNQWNGTIDLTVMPPGTYTYTWSSGEFTADLANLSPGTYEVTVSDGVSCSATASYDVFFIPDNPDIGVTTSALPHCNLSDGLINFNMAGGLPPFTYLWSNGATTEDLNNLSAGVYTVTITGANGCTAFFIHDLMASGPTFSITGTPLANTVCVGNPNGNIDVSVAPVGSYTYQWSNGATTQDINGLPEGTYTVTVSTGISCSRTATFVVLANPNGPAASTTVSQVSCFGGNNGSVDLTVTGGTPGYTYLWSNNATIPDMSGLVAGTYTVTVTDLNNCTKTTSASITQPTAISVTETHVNVLCNGGNNGSIDLTATGGTPGYTFTWSNASTTQDLTGLIAGSYSVTVSDALSCTRTRSVTVNQPTDLVLSTVITPVTCFGGSNGIADLTVIGGTPGYTYQWCNGATTQDLTNMPVITCTVTVTDLHGCFEISNAIIAGSAPLTFSIVSLSSTCSSETITGPILPNFGYNWSGPNAFTATTAAITANFSGLYSLTVTDGNGCTATDNYTVNFSGTGACGAIKGLVFHDEDESCSLDFGEPGLAGWIVRAEGANDTLYGVTNAQGQYFVGVPAGTYAMKVFVPNGLWTVCPVGVLATVGMSGDTVSGGDFPVKASYIYPALTISIGTKPLRRCFSGNYYQVEYCNQGTQKAKDAFVTVALDPFLSAVSSSIPYSDLGANLLRFEVGDLDIGECGSFKIQVYLNCNAVLGQAHCTQATIYPDTLCAPINTNWSGASLIVKSVCSPDSLRFIIRNDGKASMSNSANYIVVEDGIMFRSGVLAPLVKNDSMVLAVPANGSTWRVEVDQEAFHPYPAPVGLSVEGCTTASSFSTGYVNQFPTPDESPSIDIDCTANIGSFDPNDKYGYPVGYGSDHYVRPGTDIEYLVRFQNTGTDTAFRVEIIDTLSAWLDPASIRFGASSHPYRYDLNGEGVVHFIFENILLPDSSTNEAASNGFAKFIIKPRSDAPLETVIENTAAIYFDLNAPVVTNTTFHRLGLNFITVGLWQPFVPEAQIIAVPNPFSEETTLEVKGLRQNGVLHLQVFDLQGNSVREMESENAIFHLKKGDWQSGIYLFKITQNGRLVGSGKLVAE